MISDITVELNTDENGRLELLCKSNGIVAEHVSKAFELFNSSNEIRLKQQRALIESEYIEKINQVNKQANLEKQELKTQIMQLNDEINKVKSEENDKHFKELQSIKSQHQIITGEYDSKIRMLAENIQQEAAVKSMQFECDLKLQIAELKSQIQLSQLKLDNSNTVDSIVNHIDKNYENINRFFASSNEELGKSGEEFVHDVIQQSIYLTDKSYVENVSGQADACDLFVKHNSCLTAIEVKNHAYPIKKELVKRFMEKDMANENYNSGLFVSLKAGFSQASGINHFEIRFIHQKPCIFIANAFQRKEHIVLAIKMIDYLIANQNKDKTFINHIIQTVNSMVFRLDSLIKNNNAMLKVIRESSITINELQQDINQIIGKKSKKYKHTCECGEGFDKKVEYNRHLKNNHA